MKERVIQAKVVGYARSKGCLARKLDFGQGWPDVMFLHAGNMMFIEFKGTYGHLEPLQGHVHKLIREHGFKVYLCDDAADGCRLIDLFIDVDHAGKAVVDCSDIIKPKVQYK